MVRAKYDQFRLSSSEERSDRSSIGKRLYTGITCPHCNDQFAYIPTERIQNNKAGCCKAHLSKCLSYECPPCEEDAPKCTTTLVVHDKCIAERETLQREKSRVDQMVEDVRLELKQSKDARENDKGRMSQQLNEFKEQTERQTAEIIRHADQRWSSFATVMVDKFPTLREPVNDETIPSQMRVRERSIRLNVESEKRAMLLEIDELKLKNAGLVEGQRVLNDKFRSALKERGECVPATQYKRLLDKKDTADQTSRQREVELVDEIHQIKKTHKRLKISHSAKLTEFEKLTTHLRLENKSLTDKLLVGGYSFINKNV